MSPQEIEENIKMSEELRTVGWNDVGAVWLILFVLTATFIACSVLLIGF